MTIAFVHPQKAFLPELEAYIRFFEQYHVRCEVTRKEQVGTMHRQVEWFFMGVDFSKPRNGIYKIHEYCSASVPPRRRWKDWVKRYFNAQPDFRLFLNEYVHQRFSFHDTIPFGLRDMGIDPGWLADQGPPADKRYDFIYAGSVSKELRIEDLLDQFLPGAPLDDHTILVLSRDYEFLEGKYNRCRNIIFDGPVPHDAVAHYIRQARFAINYKPDIEPHSHQTITKLLEYAACKTPIITTDHAWVRSFQQQYGGNFFYLSPGLQQLTWEAVTNFPFEFPDLSAWTWEQQIQRSGVLQFLKPTFPEVFGQP